MNKSKRFLYFYTCIISAGFIYSAYFIIGDRGVGVAGVFDSFQSFIPQSLLLQQPAEPKLSSVLEGSKLDLEARQVITDVFVKYNITAYPIITLKTDNYNNLITTIIVTSSAGEKITKTVSFDLTKEDGSKKYEKVLTQALKHLPNALERKSGVHRGISYDTNFLIFANTQQDANEALQFAQLTKKQIDNTYFKNRNESDRRPIQVQLNHCVLPLLPTMGSSSPLFGCDINANFNNTDLYFGLLKHELTHSLFTEQFNRRDLLPDWFQEMVATLEEPKIVAAYRQDKKSIKENSFIFTNLKKMFSNKFDQFYTMPPNSNIYKSLNYLGNFLLTKGNKSKLVDLMDIYFANNENIEIAFQKVYGYKTIDLLEKDFKAWLAMQ